jgi:hypothetical protein
MEDSQDKVLSVKFTLSRADSDSYVAQWVTHAPEGRRTCWTSWLFWSLVLGYPCLVLAIFERSAGLALFVVFQIGLFLTGGRHPLRRQVLQSNKVTLDKRWKETGHLLGTPREVGIAPWGFHSASDFADTRLRWGAIRRVLCLPDVVVFEEDSQRGHLVPKRAFASPEAFAEFAALATEYHRRSTPPVINPPKRWTREKVRLLVLWIALGITLLLVFTVGSRR